MRPALRLLASLSQTTHRYLEAGAPTGLTGLLTHANPRSTLLYLYSSTLDALKQLPEHSIYRQSTEALTKHRMQIVENIKPAGLAEWQQRISQLVDEHPEAFQRVPTSVAGAKGSKDDFNVIYHEPVPEEALKTEDDLVNAAYKATPQAEGPREESDPAVATRGHELARDRVGEEAARLRIESEPPLTIEQVGEMERQISAGLIEEVIRVAQGEKELVQTLREAAV